MLTALAIKILKQKPCELFISRLAAYLKAVSITNKGMKHDAFCTLNFNKTQNTQSIFMKISILLR